ncbi:NAD(P)-dependent alcohol dehydrogenase [Paenibacillus sp. GCM10027627]|uniref:NAD(P)-dependent alcohol dehydrogenase n=1 Tax=unclassified Paenibacillus TaxID=185978 RepID=UPI003639BD4B
MKAIICPKYGSPDVLELKEINTPESKSNEVRIKLRAAVVGPADCAFRRGDPFVVRLIYGLKRPRNPMLGVEFSGVVDAVGKEVTGFKTGDPVIGLSANKMGAHAEYLCLPEHSPLIVKSSRLTFEEAAAVCDGAPTALIFLRDKAKIQSGQRVLINGASGAVGLYAVQLAKALGAEVTGVCSGSNLERVSLAGADFVIDYTKEDFTASGKRYDVIFDAVGKRSFSECKGALTEAGVYLSTVPGLSILFHMLRTAVFGGQKAVFVTAGLMQSKNNLTYLQQLAEAGKLKAMIDRRYPLEQMAEAHRYVDTERKRGNVIITYEP